MADMVLNEDKDPSFYIGLGERTPIPNNPSKMSQVTIYKGNGVIFVRNGGAIRISHIGEVRLKTKYKDQKLKNLLVVS